MESKTNSQDVLNSRMGPEPHSPQAEVEDSTSTTAASDCSSTTVGEGASEKKVPGDRKQKAFGILKRFLIDQWLILGIGVVIAIASQVHVPESQQALKQTVVTYLSVSLIFFITGLTLPTRVLIENYSRWRLHIYVQVACFLMDTATTYAVVTAAASNREFMDPALLVGLISMACTPTTISSNIVMTMQSEGNSALTVVQSTIGNFLGPFVSPSLLTLYTRTGAWYTEFLPATGSSFNEIYRRVFKQLGLSIFLPMVVGQVIQNLFPRPVQKLKDWNISKLGTVALLAMIWQTFDEAFAAGAFTSVKSSNMIFIVFISIALFFFWLAVTLGIGVIFLKREDVVSTAFCIPAKTPAMGVPMATVMFVGLSQLDSAKLQIPIVIFQGLQIFFSSFLTHVFRRWIRAGKKAEAQAAKTDTENAFGPQTVTTISAPADSRSKTSYWASKTSAMNLRSIFTK